MKLEEHIYPYVTQAKNLPFYLTGIGGSNYQGAVSRPDGYHWNQILFCGEGEGVLEFDNESYEISAGSCFFLPKNYPHKYHPETDIWDIRWISFDGLFCEQVLNQLKMTIPKVVFKIENKDMEEIFDKMVLSRRKNILYSDFTCSGLVYDYILEFHRYLESGIDSRKGKLFTKLVPALDYISENFNKDFPLTLLSEMIDVTPQHFCRIFKETMDMRPIEYLTIRRVEHAKLLICQNTHSLSQIAEMSGFSDTSYFSTVFRKYVGVSPMQYRQQVNNYAVK